jgi:uncharacterized membrane protein YhaH (DUF805 family)
MVAGALFGAVAWQLGRVQGRRAVLIIWLLATIVFAALYVVRVLYMWHALGMRADGERLLVVFTIASALIALVLALPALSVARRLRNTPTQSIGTVARGAAGLALGGMFLMLLIAVVVDISAALLR